MCAVRYWSIFSDSWSNNVLQKMKIDAKFKKKKLLLRCMHHFESDLINNKDHMRISDTVPSSMILIQTVKF